MNYSKLFFLSAAIVGGALFTPYIYAADNGYQSNDPEVRDIYSKISYLSDNNEPQEQGSNYTAPKENKKSSPASAEKKSFSGFYLGAGGAYNMLSYDYSSDYGQGNAENSLGNVNSNQFNAVFKGGYGYQFDNNFYLGLEYSLYPLSNSKNISYDGNNGKFHAGATFDQKSFSVLTLTPGYVLTNLFNTRHDLLIKLELGASYGSYKFYKETYKNDSNDEVYPNSIVDESKESLGYVVGLGSEFSITSHLSLFVNYKYLYNNTLDYGPDANAQEGQQFHVQPSSNMVETGINWRF